eukprot:scaffold10467_cov36-Tisochrysis_lutea.AAC.5
MRKRRSAPGWWSAGATIATLVPVAPLVAPLPPCTTAAGGAAVGSRETTPSARRARRVVLWCIHAGWGSETEHGGGGAVWEAARGRRKRGETSETKEERRHVARDRRRGENWGGEIVGGRGRGEGRLLLLGDGIFYST